MRENYYNKILKKCHRRHNKVPIIGTPKVEKQIDWEKLNNYFKSKVYGNKNMDGNLERMDATFHKT